MRWEDCAAAGLLCRVELAEHRVRVYENRLAIWRRDGARMTWEELQRVKEQVWGDEIAVEVYPLRDEVVNLRHTRHLWRAPQLTDAVRAACVHPEFTHG